jgi:hypothetical protein
MTMTIIEKIEEYKNTEAVDYLESALEDLREDEKQKSMVTDHIIAASGLLTSTKNKLLSALNHASPVEAVLIQTGLESLTKTANLVASIQNALEAKA